MPASPTVNPRVPISLRLPRDVIKAVDSFAKTHGMSKTDAFLHFLRRGIDGGQTTDSPQLQHISSQLDQVLSLLAQSRSDAGNGAQADSVTEAIRDAAGQFAAIERAYVFGSFARGEATDDSDIDVRLELAEDARFTLRDLDHFAKSVEHATGRSVDVLTARTIQNQALANAFERDKVMVYERQTR